MGTSELRNCALCGTACRVLSTGEGTISVTPVARDAAQDVLSDMIFGLAVEVEVPKDVLPLTISELEFMTSREFSEDRGRGWSQCTLRKLLATALVQQGFVADLLEQVRELRRVNGVLDDKSEQMDVADKELEEVLWGEPEYDGDGAAWECVARLVGRLRAELAEAREDGPQSPARWNQATNAGGQNAA